VVVVRDRRHRTGLVERKIVGDITEDALLGGDTPCWKRYSSEGLQPWVTHAGARTPPRDCGHIRPVPGQGLP